MSRIKNAESEKIIKMYYTVCLMSKHRKDNCTGVLSHDICKIPREVRYIKTI